MMTMTTTMMTMMTTTTMTMMTTDQLSPRQPPGVLRWASCEEIVRRMPICLAM